MLVDGRLIRIYFKDRPPRIIRAFSVLSVVLFAFFIFVPNDLLDVLIGDPVKFKEEFPSLHVGLDHVDPMFLDFLLLVGVQSLESFCVIRFFLRFLDLL